MKVISGSSYPIKKMHSLIESCTFAELRWVLTGVMGRILSVTRRVFARGYVSSASPAVGFLANLYEWHVVQSAVRLDKSAISTESDFRVNVEYGIKDFETSMLYGF